ncbi:MAG: septal ring lytic transglycosylase RlpA family protein [Gammaproteobacteria bacterium]|nr:septal ring lytic transglycosylase RlpA family protein [Gammaproteobacteria bacterium]
MSKPAINPQRATQACLLAAAVLLAGCVPARWPEKPATAPAPVPPAAASQRPKPVKPAPPPLPPPSPDVSLAEQAPEPLPRSRSGNPPFYEVLGERYFVMDDSEGYREQGVASWYGAPFHGRRTSSGTVYDMHDFTAAHKTLPLPTLVRVTNLDNGRSVVVTVDDRGPFVKNRLIDLSFAAAKELGIVESGTGRVEVEAVRTRRALSASAAAGPTAAGAAAGAQRLFMQVGAFSDEANAARLKGSLESNGVNNVIIRYDDEVRPGLYRVRIGPIKGSAEYDALASRLAALSIANPRLVTESPVARETSSAP